ncbi:phosphate/phosphite/phosphonate ABC transporter substrate-binding protein [uncultured Methylobacterium sp.]|uniref:phosphate/phosphite/phosphonate ABC transporter substrate-binding protein n=1 Tax=uncultured Methylobacterium sp. TaxID=157278 RepID=UPI0035CA2C2F
MTLPLATNARMYAITPQAAIAWDAIFKWLAASTGLPLAALDHPPPASLAGLWSRPRIGCAVMCGWPFIEAHPRPYLLGTPIPSPPRYRGRPQYWSDLVVRADSTYMSIEDTFGGTLGWTIADSQSGFNMLRHHLIGLGSTPDAPLYARSVEGLVNPLGALKAVVDGRVDVAPVDSFCHDLLKAGDHPATRATRTIAATASSPMPVLVASPDIGEGEARRLSEALCTSHRDPQMAPHLAAALVERFVVPDTADFEYCRSIDRAARGAGHFVPM